MIRNEERSAMGLGTLSNEMNDVPAELIGAKRRKVHLTRTGWTYALAGSFFVLLGVAGAIYIMQKTVPEAPPGGWWSIIYPLAVVIFGVLLVRRFPLQHRLANEGVAARACITEREWKGPSRGPIMVDYTFRNVNDEVGIGSCPSEYPRKAGSFVWILYLSSDPRRSAIYPLEFFRLDQ
jgi:hypothetical protein